jgi:DNA invertase Pin-like site-specific DNA recombinase
MMGVFAEFERKMIRERVAAGLERARAKGKTLGRPKVGERIERKIRAGYAAGKSKRGLSRELGISDGTVRRVLAEHA